MEALLSLLRGPADEAVTRLGLPCGCPEAEQGDDASGGPDEVPQLVSRERLVAEVVVAIDVFVVEMGVVALGDEL